MSDPNLETHGLQIYTIVLSSVSLAAALWLVGTYLAFPKVWLCACSKQSLFVLLPKEVLLCWLYHIKLKKCVQVRTHNNIMFLVFINAWYDVLFSLGHIIGTTAVFHDGLCEVQAFMVTIGGLGGALWTCAMMTHMILLTSFTKVYFIRFYNIVF